jgi:hypothetical protein
MSGPFSLEAVLRSASFTAYRTAVVLHSMLVVSLSGRVSWMMLSALPKVTMWTSHHLSVIVNLAERPPRLLCMHVLASAPTLLTIMWPTPSCSPALCVGRQVPMGEMRL